MINKIKDVRTKSAQKNSRIEIRVNEKLLEKINKFCNDNGIDRTYYITTLIRQNLKKSGYFKVEKEHKYWNGDIEDMPLELEAM